MLIKEGVLAIVIDDQQRVLLVKRRDVPLWVLPGGGIDDGESVEDAALREVKEEAGLNVAIERKGALFSPINNLANDTHIFICRPSRVDSVPTASDETTAAAFFPLKQYPKNTFEIHVAWIDEILGEAQETIHRPLYEINYRRLLRYFLRHPWHIITFLWAKAT